MLNTYFDIIAISETGLKNLDIVGNIFPGYTFVLSKIPTFPTTKLGGVGIYITEQMYNKATTREDLNFNNNEQIEDMWIEIDDKYIIGLIYRHPKSNKEIFTDCLEKNLAKIALENKLCIVCGDINIDLLSTNTNDAKKYLNVLLS